MKGRGRRGAALAGLVLLAATGDAWAAQGRRGGGRGGDRPPRDRELEVFLTDIPAYRGNVILGRPTDRSVTLNLLLRESAKSVRVVYGTSPSALDRGSGVLDLKPGEPREVLLEGLEKDTAFEYRVVDAGTGEPLLPEEGNGRFRTCRAPGSPFTFAVQADSHLDGSVLPELYKVCLKNVVADKPDFFIDLGDTFMTGKHESRDSAALQYAAQRYYFGQAGQVAPVFLVIGNHDGEEVRRPEDAGKGGLAVWSCLQRKRLFPNPAPDAFYSGNPERNPEAGLLQDYFAWTWGDALLVVLDPYWVSRTGRGGKDPWSMTLGRDQYDWLAATLRESKARRKFVFIHQLVGGTESGGRGGAEVAPLFEWGDGRGFAAHRAGWGKPIHALLVETGVSIVFHGHDHFFARQELDGIVYQLVPQPAHRNYRNHQAVEYGYKAGEFLPNSGHVRVRVAAEGVTVEYIRAATPEMERRGVRNGEVAFRYAVPGP